MNAAAKAHLGGLAVLDQRGRWIGTVQRAHLNHTTGQPEWMTVGAGRWVTTRHIAPLAGSSLRRRGVQLPYNRCAVHQAPEILDPDRMDLRDQFALYSHYLQSVAARSRWKLAGSRRVSITRASRSKRGCGRAAAVTNTGSAPRGKWVERAPVHATPARANIPKLLTAALSLGMPWAPPGWRSNSQRP